MKLDHSPIVSFFFGLLIFSAPMAQAEAARAINHTTVTGVVYARDNSLPKLGEAYRDPRGLIWGDSAVDSKDGQLKQITLAEARKFCSRRHARLATQAEARQLRIDLGGDHSDIVITHNFSPFIKDGPSLVLPNSYDSRYGSWTFWVEELDPESGVGASFAFTDGEFWYGNSKRLELVRCVSGSRAE